MSGPRRAVLYLHGEGADRELQQERCLLYVLDHTNELAVAAIAETWEAVGQLVQAGQVDAIVLAPHWAPQAVAVDVEVTAPPKATRRASRVTRQPSRSQR